jgi:hypothetical protein
MPPSRSSGAFSRTDSMPGAGSWYGLSELQVALRLGRRLGLRWAPGGLIGYGARPDGRIELAPDTWVMLEVEQGQHHPAANVLKYWPWLEGTRTRLVLVHAIAPDASKRQGPRTDLALWTGEKMRRQLRGRFAYCRVELGTDTETEDIQRARAAIAAFGPIGQIPTDRMP